MPNKLTKYLILVGISFSQVALAENQAKGDCESQALLHKQAILQQTQDLRQTFAKDAANVRETRVAPVDTVLTILYLAALQQGVSKLLRVESTLKRLEQGAPLRRSQKNTLAAICQADWNVWPYISE